MRELTFEENKAHQLNILKEVAAFCEANNIRYYLAFGTLIGAIRHHGFIPWDDDIDIQMPREDYERFLKTFKSEHHTVINPYEARARHSMAKVIDERTIKIERAIKVRKGEELGVDVDVFPVDGQPDDEKTFLQYFKRKRRLYKLFYYSISDISGYSWKGKIAYCLPYLIAQCIKKSSILKRIDKITAEYPYAEAKYVGSTSSLYEGPKNRTPREWYEGSVDVEFEGLICKAPVGYHDILTKLYGDYMQLPPEEQRVTHHSNWCYLKEEQ